MQARLSKREDTPAPTDARVSPSSLVCSNAMDFTDISSDFVVDESGSRLLSESLVHSSRSISTGHGGEDLSLSELSLSDPPQPQSYRRRPFSLLARPRTPDTNGGAADESALVDDDDGYGDELNETVMQEDAEKAQKAAGKTREERLQSDLYILKKLNAAFEVYKDALRETKTSTEVCTRAVCLGLKSTKALPACSRSTSAHECTPR